MKICCHCPSSLVSWFNSFNKQKWLFNLIYHKVCFERKRANLKEWIWVFARTLCFRRAMLVRVLMLSKWLYWETPGVEAVKKKRKHFWLCSDICSWSPRPLYCLDSIFHLKPQWTVCSTHSECWAWSLVIWIRIEPQPGSHQTRALPVGGVCVLGTLLMFTTRSSYNSSHNSALTYKTQVQWITLWEKK